MLRFRNVTFDCADPAKLAEFWSAVTGYEIAHVEAQLVRLSAGPGQFPRLLFMKVPEGKATKNRVHLDFMAEDLERDVERLVALGARRGATVEERGFRWVVLYDPEDNEFCVVQSPPAAT